MKHNPLWGLFILLNLGFAVYFTVDSINSWQSNPTVTSGKKHSVWKSIKKSHFLSKLYCSELTRYFSSAISGSDDLLPQIINVSRAGWYDGICAPGWDKGNTKNHGCMHAMDTQELLLSKNNQSCCTQTKNKMAMVISSQWILFGYIW